MTQRKFNKRDSIAPAPLAARLSLKQFPPAWLLSALNGVPDRFEPPDVRASLVPVIAVVMGVRPPVEAVTVGVVVSVTVAVGVAPGVVVTVGIAPGVVVSVGVTTAVGVFVGVGEAGVFVGVMPGVTIAVGVVVTVGTPTVIVGEGVGLGVVVTPGVGVARR